MTKPRSTDVQRIATAATIRISHGPFEWAFARDRQGEIARHWEALRVERPALFNGRVLLSRNVELCADTLTGFAFTTDYAEFIGWRDGGFPGDPSIANLFAMAALQSNDGAFLLGSMAASTSNAGRLYFPAGTPEPEDVGTDGFVQFDNNILRELAEETGIGADRVTLDPTWTIVFAGPHIACLKGARLDGSADQVIAEVDAFIRDQDHAELDGIYPVRGLRDLDERRMHPFMLHYLRSRFALS